MDNKTSKTSSSIKFCSDHFGVGIQVKSSFHCLDVEQMAHVILFS